MALMATAVVCLNSAGMATARALAETLSEGGLRIISGGTDNHLMLVDVGSAGLSGRDAEDRLHAVDITCNKNLIPFDERPPMEASGIRLGTAAITTRGLGEADVRELGRWIVDILCSPAGTTGEGDTATRVRASVGELCRTFPIYQA